MKILANVILPLHLGNLPLFQGRTCRCTHSPIPSKIFMIMFGNLMWAARDEDVATSSAALDGSSQRDGDGAADNDNDNETTGSGDVSTAVEPSSADSDDSDDVGQSDGSGTESSCDVSCDGVDRATRWTA
jgi:hypothetical protein|eukprot:COSAG06_NODE_898_length_11667_cov_4.407244_4_plen_130_part_00